MARKTVKRVKTGAIERRFTLARIGVVAGTRFAAASAGNLFSSKENRSERQHAILAKQSQWLVGELGKLKGTIVKMGQMMALFGEHFLPQEVTDALHTLEDDTTALAWLAIEKELIKSLGEERLSELDIDQTPLAAASLGQVHIATRKSDGQKICLKVQYPGVAAAIDSDINALVLLLKLSRVVPITQEFNSWVDEVREMMHREVNYELELATTDYFRIILTDDPRYIVPQTFHRYCTPTIIATSYQQGVGVSDESVLELPQARRNNIGRAIMELFCNEVFVWSRMQTDPNFGNYLIHLAEDEASSDRIVLLDFGAIRDFEDEIIMPARKMIYSSYWHDSEGLVDAFQSLGFLSKKAPHKVIRDFTELCFMGVEVLQNPDRFPVPESVVNDRGQYKWGESDLPTRILAKAGKSAFSLHFDVPPKDLIFLGRKLLGAYTFLHVIGAQVRGNEILDPFLQLMEKNGEVESRDYAT